MPKLDVHAPVDSGAAAPTPAEPRARGKKDEGVLSGVLQLATARSASDAATVKEVSAMQKYAADRKYEAVVIQARLKDKQDRRKYKLKKMKMLVEARKAGFGADEIKELIGDLGSDDDENGNGAAANGDSDRAW